ncbi:MAG TPA: GAF domain-containing protein, partial [Anaerolineae bacterium]|nr:GAF domain-containing protein [Anaerolineae bacterium]
MLQQNRKEFSDIAPRLQSALQAVVDDAAARLGCIGAIATTLENDGGLYVRAAAFQVPAEQAQRFLADSGLDVTGSTAVLYLDEKKYRYNLGVSAVKGVNGRARAIQQPYLVSDRLYDLLRPLAGEETARRLQTELGISQVVAVPFIVADEVVGSLMAAAAKPFDERDIDFLVAFARQAASSIENHYRLTAMESLEKVIFSLQAKMTDETKVLQAVVDSVVFELGYAGAMVATLERGNALPVRAYALDDRPQILAHLEEKAGVKLLSPKAVVYLDDDYYKDNLSVRAVKGVNGRPQKYLTSNKLYDLLRPIVRKSLADFAQQMLGIRAVIAVPFFVEDEVVGNLFV